MSLPAVSVAIPTYRREKVLLNTVAQLLSLKHGASEILIVDQTGHHHPETSEALEQLVLTGSVIWHRSTEPSIPKAMNYALKSAKYDVVLFLDDDIELTSEIVIEHAREYEDAVVTCVAGRVVQPWENESGEAAMGAVHFTNADAFPFSSSKRCMVGRFMGGNFSIRKQVAVDLGGFDENFIKVAYRFEAEFAERLLATGARILFQPTASLMHLKIATGGTRSFGHHLTSIRPGHSVGKYYYLLMAKTAHHRIRRFVFGPLLAISTKHHLARPWWIPVTLCSEIAGTVWALWLFARGPQHIDIREPS